MKLTKNFNSFEFDCKDGTKVPIELIDNVRSVATNLQVLRNGINESIHINSGYRTVSHNKTVKGKKNSYHLKGLAADITAKNYSSIELKKIIEVLINLGYMKQGGLFLYSGFVHYDIRGTKAR